MFEFLKKIFQKPNPELPEAVQGIRIREINDMDGIWLDVLVHGEAYVVVRPPERDAPPWYAHDEAYL